MFCIRDTMDIIAHALWTVAVFAVINKKLKKKLNLRFAAAFGVFPDFFAFAPLFIWLFFGLVSGSINFSVLPHPGALEPARADSLFMFRLTSTLYSISHSIFVFLGIFSVAWLMRGKKPAREMGGWLLHILIDIPSHSYRFFPTPFLWPISSWKLDGLSWASPGFMIVNYSLLVLVFVLLRRKKYL